MWLTKLKNLFRKPVEAPTSLLSKSQAKELAEAINPPPQPKGKVVNRTRRPEYQPLTRRHGGRIVKVMPRQLKQIKEAQEKVSDETV